MTVPDSRPVDEPVGSVSACAPIRFSGRAALHDRPGLRRPNLAASPPFSPTKAAMSSRLVEPLPLDVDGAKDLHLHRLHGADRLERVVRAHEVVGVHEERRPARGAGRRRPAAASPRPRPPARRRCSAGRRTRRTRAPRPCRRGTPGGCGGSTRLKSLPSTGARLGERRAARRRGQRRAGGGDEGGGEAATVHGRVHGGGNG